LGQSARPETQGRTGVIKVIKTHRAPEKRVRGGADPKKRRPARNVGPS